MPPNAAKKHTALRKGGTAMAGSGATSTPPMQQPKEMNSTPNTERAQGPTTSDLGSAGPQADEHGAEEMPGMEAQPGPLPDMRNDPTERGLRRH